MSTSVQRLNGSICSDRFSSDNRDAGECGRRRCGSSTPTRRATSGQRASQAGARHSGLSYARCMRSHGVSRFPDPTATGGFDPNAAGINHSSPAVKAAETACERLLPAKHVPFSSRLPRPTRGCFTGPSACASTGSPVCRTPSRTRPGAQLSCDQSLRNGDGRRRLLGWDPDNDNAHSPAFLRLSTPCGESPNGR